MEKKDLDDKKKVFTPRGAATTDQGQGQGGEQKEDKKKVNQEEEGWGSYYGIAVLGAALVVAGATYFGRKAMAK